MEEFVPVVRASDVPDGGAVAVEAHGHRIALFRLGDRYLAIGARCPHAGGPLEEGYVKEGAVICPWHGSRFRLETGEILGGPAPVGVPAFQVQVSDGNVLIGPPPPGTAQPPPSLF